jgi:glycosyltransferase involved in cell wall biosynthesis
MGNISIITPTVGGWATQAAWLEAFKKHTPPELVKELIIVWDAPRNITNLIILREELLAYNPIIIVNSSPIGISKAFNQGAKISNGRYICFLEDAIFVTPGWLEGLKEALDKRPEFGWVATHQIENPKATFTSMCSLILKETFDAVDGFDPRLEVYDDADLILRLRHTFLDRRVLIREGTGENNVYNPHGIADIKISHPHTRTTTAPLRGGKDSKPEQDHFKEMRRRFREKHAIPDTHDFDWSRIPVTTLEELRK